MRVRAIVAGALAVTYVVGSYWLMTRIQAAGWNVAYLVEHVAFHLLLAAVFGLTLRGAREPLVTALARRVHGSLTADMVTYSRKVTVVWTAYFVAMAAISVGIFVLAPFDLWAAFASLGTPLAIVSLFVGEYLVRYRLHPEFERATLAAAFHAYSSRRERHD